jgi:alkanesulfonate monooxygenase
LRFIMRMGALKHGLKVFSTCPVAAPGQPGAAVRQLEEMARWSEDAGCEGVLVFTDNRQLDPWLVSQVIIKATARLCPLVAIQPTYMHPYSVAKMIASMAVLYGRRVHLNMVAGGFKNDLEALGDATPHDERYARLVEYAHVVRQLLADPGPLSFEGRYYSVRNLKLTPALPKDLQPELLASGSSEAGVQAARKMGAIAVEYPKPPSAYAVRPAEGLASGIRVGVIARYDDAQAWQEARARFPEDRKGQLTHQIAMKVSDSQWHRQLSELGASDQGSENTYWLSPFKNYQALCPYLVGSYDRVAEEVARYIDIGYRTFILEAPASADELWHTGVAFERAVARRTATA